MKHTFKRYIALLLSLCILSTANGGVVYALDSLLFGDTRAAGVLDLLTDMVATIKQGDVTIDEDTNIDSKKPISVAVSFGVPLIGDGGAEGTYVVKGDTATIALATGFAIDGGDRSFDLNHATKKVGTLTFATTADKKTSAAIVFDGDADIFDGDEGWMATVCTFNITLNYDGTGADGAEGDHSVSILGKNYTVVVPPEPTVVDMTKTGVRDGQLINWTMEIEATQVGGTGDLTGYVFSDDLTNVGSYVTDSFKTGATNVVGDATAATPDSVDPTLTYIFPTGTAGSIFVFFTTEIPDEKFFTNGEQNIKNTAQILKDGTEVCKAENTVTFIGEWIKKEAGTIDHTTGTIKWVITANPLGASLLGATITDVLDSKLDFVSATLQIDTGTANPINPTDGVYDLGAITTPVYLTISAKLKDTSDLLHTVYTVANTATLNWTGGTGIGSNTVNSSIGLNPISKTATAYDVPSHTASWKVSVVSSDITTNLRVADLLIYGPEVVADDYKVDYGTANLTEIDKDTFESLPKSFNQKYVDGSWAAVGGANLKVTVYPVTNAADDRIGDLLIVTKGDDTEIDVSASTQAFTFDTLVTNPDIYLNNKDNPNAVTNYATLLSGNVKVNGDSASQHCPSRIIDKDVLSVTAAAKDLTVARNANASAGAADNSFNYEDKSVVYRLHINAGGATIAGGTTTVDGVALGAVTITDTLLPTDWEFIDIAADTPFLIYEATGNSNTKQVTATALASNIPGADFTTAGKVTFTFATLAKPYMILLRAQPTEATAKDYFEKNDTYTQRNNASLTVADWEDEASDYEDVNIVSKTLSKSSALKEKGVVTWTVDYMPYGMEYPTAVIEDTLPIGLDLFMDSTGALNLTEGFTIHKLSIKPDGATTLGDPVTDKAKFISYDMDTRVLKFAVQDQKQAYRFSYHTNITGDSGTNLTNAAKLSQGHGSAAGVNAQYKVNDDDASATMKRSGWVQISKKDENNGPLAGAEFTIFTADGITPFRKGSTVANGVVTLRGLPLGEYVLKETLAPAGYVLSSAVHKVTVVKDGGSIITSINGKTGADTNKITIENLKTGTVGSVSVSKSLMGNLTDPQKPFDFTIALTGIVDGDYPTIKNGTLSETIAFTDGEATFALKGGESLLIHNLPKDTAYTIKEADYSTDGYTATQTGDLGTITADAVQSAVFVNSKNSTGGGGSTSPIPPIPPAPPIDITLSGEKILNGEAAVGSEFSFVLKNASGIALQTVANNGKEIQLSPLTFDSPGTHLYTLSEIKGSDANITYDTTVYTIIVHITKESTLSAAVSYLENGIEHSGNLVFNNTSLVVPPVVPPAGGTGGAVDENGEYLDPNGPPRGQGEGIDDPLENLDSTLPLDGMPNTGEKNLAWLWLLAMLLSASGMVALALKQKRKTTQK